MKISSLMVALILTGIIIISIVNVISNLNSNYSTNINETSLEEFNNIQSITNLTEQTKTEVEGISDNPNFVDKLSSFFNSGIIALKTTFSSFKLINNMINSGMDKIGLGIYATAIKSLFLILVIIGVAISAIIKWRA